MLRRATNVGIAAVMRSIGSTRPITPVEPTNTWCKGMERCSATALAIVFAATNPCSPVQALAFPLLAIIARPRRDRRWCRSSKIGAATMRFFVKTPAIGPLTSDTQRAKSNRSGFLIPQWIPAALNPSGAVIPTCSGLIRVRGGWLGITGRCGEAGLLRNAEHQIHGLNGLTSGSFDEIIDRRHGDDPSGPRILVQ